MRTFILPIDPIPKGRPRLSTKTGRIYTPKRTEEFQNEIRKRVCYELGKYFDFPMYPKEVPVCIDIDFVFRRPKPLQTRKYPEGFLWRPKGDDVDNLEKAVYDALNGILWHDDRQIVEGRTRKLWAKRGEDAMIVIVVKKACDPPLVTCDFWNEGAVDLFAGRKAGE